MDSEIIAASILGTATVVAAVLPLLRENLKWAPISAKRRKLVCGSWRGVTHQAVGPDGSPMDVEIITEISTSWRRLKTHTRIRGGGIELKSTARGGFVWGDYLVATYKNINPNLVNFGTVLLRLHADGRHLSGRMIGYGTKSERIIHGEMELEKVED